MPDLATTQDDLGTVHFSRFMVVGDESGDWRTTGEVTVRLEFHADAPKPGTDGDSPGKETA